MTQEEKQLLLKDLCTRLPYGVLIEVDYLCNEEWQSKYPTNKDVDTLKTIDLNEELVVTNGYSSYDIEEIKPYLRPMSSMTEEEEWKYNYIKENHTNWEAYDYLNSIHIDYRGLIPMGLAIEAPKGMYC
ncbi:MAG: hypothetical protein J6X18_00710 [Bacteroidales bacterium]|nr:hypothetical protein [Bacteroidales bacterium]